MGPGADFPDMLDYGAPLKLTLSSSNSNIGASSPDYTVLASKYNGLEEKLSTLN